MRADVGTMHNATAVRLTELRSTVEVEAMSKKKPIKALTVWQPWAALLAVGIKTVENRTWSPAKGGLVVGDFIAIHAGAVYKGDEWSYVVELKKQLDALGRWNATRRQPWPITPARPDPKVSPSSAATPYGAIIAVAVLDEVRKAPRSFSDTRGSYEDPFWCGPFGWYLRDPVPFEPVACSGQQGLWTPDDSVLAIVRERYKAAA